MLKKVLDTIKATSILWICILIPLLIGMRFIKSSSRGDALKCVDSFIEDEGVGLSKYVGLQIENSRIYIENLWGKIEGISTLDDKDHIHDCISKCVKSDQNIAYINLYNEEGILINSSLEEGKEDIENIDIEEDKIKNIGENVLYSIDQLEKNKLIVIKYLTQRYIGGKKVFFEIAMKWSQYEGYINSMQEGVFPRMFYIVSPDCRRYISLNSLPSSSANKENAIALGLHLVNKLQSIKDGLSDIKIESYNFRIYKDEIKTNENMKGNKFYIIIATGDSSFERLSKSMLNSLPTILMLLIAAWLVLCIVLSRFYNRTKDELEIATIIADSTPLAIAIFRVSDGKIMRINLSAMTLFRIEKGAIDTKNLWDLFIYDDDRSYIFGAASSNINVLNYEVLAQSFGGGSFWAICSASPVEIQEEKYIVLAVLDINRRKEIEKKLANNAALLEQQIAERTRDLELKARELEESNSLLENAKAIADEANSAKSKFLTNISNELKTPINAIIGYSEILQEEALDRKDTVSADDLRKIIGSAKHLLSLIDEILDLSKIEAGKTRLFFENVEIPGIIKDIEGVTMPLIANNDNSLFLEYNKEIGSMYTDATKLRQCLLNLLSNAAKFTQFGKVTLRVTSVVIAGVDFIEFSVVDTGCGISQDRLDNIFEPFHDGNSSSSGAGLGLSLTKKYTEYMGGTITVESEIGIGSKFVIRIPRVSEVESNEFIEVKNKKTNEDDLAEQLMEDIENADLDKNLSTHIKQNDNSTFGRKSEL